MTGSADASSAIAAAAVALLAGCRALADAPSDGDALNNLAVALMRQRRRLDEAEALGGRDAIYWATLAEVRAARQGP
jgi:hypothetical protein